MEILALEDLSFRYPGCTENAVDGVSLTVREGEFLLLCGRSGCGKTTLLKLIKRELAPHGELSGNILFRSRPLDSLTDRESAQKIGYVLQSPEAQIVTDKVWHELAFGLESLGTDTPTIRQRQHTAARRRNGKLFRHRRVVQKRNGRPLGRAEAVAQSRLRNGNVARASDT